MTEHHDPRTPITLLSGFLGAGKTTLLNHILTSDHGLRIAVLVNDFGAVNIDAGLVVSVEGDTVSLSNGCICCTIRDDLIEAVQGLLARQPAPEYLIVETSGVSDPVAVANSFMLPSIKKRVRIDSILVVVDSLNFREMDDDLYARALSQLDVADLIVLNKTDLAGAETVAALRRHIESAFPYARILEAAHARIPLELALGVGRFDATRLTREAEDIHVHAVGEHHDHDHDHDHGKVFDSWVWEADRPAGFAALQTVFDQLPRTVYRAKGVLYLADYPEHKVILQMVGKRAALSFAGKWADVGETPRTQVVMIASHGGMDVGALRAAFEAALQS